MPDSRIKKPWIRNPSARARQSRRERRFALEPLENRTSLSAGLDIGTNLAPAEIGSASASLTSASGLEAVDKWHERDQTDTDDADHAAIGAAGEPDAREHSDTGDTDDGAIEPGGEPDARDQSDTGDTDHSAIGAAGEPDSREQTETGDTDVGAIEPGGEPDARDQSDTGDTNHSAIEPSGDLYALAKTDSGNADAAGQGSANGADGNTSSPTAPANDGGQSTPDPSSDPSQDGSDGAANTSPNAPDAPVAPAAAADQADFNPGLLDPLAWTVSDDQPFADVTDSFDDGQNPLLPATGAGAGAADPSTLMGRPDDVAIGGSADSHSAVGWGADAFALPARAPDLAQAGRDPFAADPFNDSIGVGATAWRRLSNGRDGYDETSSNDDEHIAELSPLDHSASLALAATLWGTPAQSRLGPDPGSIRSGATNRHLDVEPSTSSWKVFVMGLDQALEQSYRDVRLRLTAETGSTVETEQSRREAADRLEWRGVIVPVARPLEIDSSSAASGTAAASPSAGASGSFVPAVIQLGEFLFENLVNPVLGHKD
jgi:hypothetical protein